MCQDECFESGPFCRHFNDPETCPEDCAVCGHSCADHSESSGCDTCDCDTWRDEDSKEAEESIFTTRHTQAGTWIETPRASNGAAGFPLFFVPNDHPNETELASQIAHLLTIARVSGLKGLRR